jgi:hypothetical protein
MAIKIVLPKPGPFAFVREPGTDLYRRVDRGPGGAYDSKNGLGKTKKYPRERIKQLLDFVETLDLDADVRAEIWRLAEQSVDDWSHPLRGNGAYA